MRVRKATLRDVPLPVTPSPSNLNDASMAWALASPQASRVKSAAAAETPGSFPFVSLVNPARSDAQNHRVIAAV